MIVRLLPQAERDLADGAEFYETIRQGLGRYFIDRLLANIDKLTYLGGVHERQFGFFRMIAKSFPFAVYYRIDSEFVEIYAVLDCRRDPRFIEERLRGN